MPASAMLNKDCPKMWIFPAKQPDHAALKQNEKTCKPVGVGTSHLGFSWQ